jgi:hypothetical protein
MNDNDDQSDKASEERRHKLVKAGFAVGIGSAAIVAALLYASTVKKNPKKKPAGTSRSHGDHGTD